VNDPVRQILLNQIQDLQSAERRKAFEVHLPDDVSLFICSSKADMEDWVRDIRRLCNTRGSSSSSFNGELPDNNVNGQALYEGRELQVYPIVKTGVKLVGMSHTHTPAYNSQQGQGFN